MRQTRPQKSRARTSLPLGRLCKTLNGTMNNRIFQVLVIVDIVLSLIAGLYDYLLGTEVSSKTIEFVATIEPEGSDLSFYIFMAYAFLVLLLVIVSIIGLLRFKDWGRKCYLASFGLAAIAYPFLGVSVFSGTGQLLNDSSFLLSGFLLATMYLSALKQEFE